MTLVIMNAMIARTCKFQLLTSWTVNTMLLLHSASFVAISPDMLKCGQLVELTVAFWGVKRGERQHTIDHHLVSVTLIDRLGGMVRLLLISAFVTTANTDGH